jgi:hypothetical protein
MLRRRRTPTQSRATFVMMRDLMKALGRRLRPLLRPDWADEERRLDRIERLAADTARRQEEAGVRAAATDARLGRLDDLAERRAVDVLSRQVRELRRSVGAHARVTTQALRGAARLDERAVAVLSLDRRIRRGGEHGGVLAGPWTGEVGFELLYWIPFLRRLRRQLGEASMHVVSRGGSAVWYGGVADGAVDAFDCVDADTFRRETDRENRKQRRVSGFDRQLISAARRRLAIGRAPIVHPSLMYELLYPYWKDQMPARLAYEQLEFSRLERPAPIDGLQIPQPYFVARFYFSACFPDTQDNRTFVVRTVRALAERATVVVLGLPFAVDDHRDVPLDLPGVITVDELMTPANNLAIQSAVIAGAAGFVGTYGGFSYLAPFYGVPSVGCYSADTFFPHHLDLARRVFTDLGGAGLTVLDVRQQGLLDAALGAPHRA